MSYFPRQLVQWALSPETLQGRMAFIAGPRQIGKTTTIQQFLVDQNQRQLYYNWDTPTVKKRYATNPLFFIGDIPPELSHCWLALDEIHKYPKWKNILKGYYDEWHQKIRFIITGSARLDLFRKSGDSLVGRYFLFKMLPLGIREIASGISKRFQDWSPLQELPPIPPSEPLISEVVENLLNLTGYPEPFAVGTQEFCTRWRDNHISLILEEDLRDLTKIVQIRKLETLLYLLPERAGSPLSLNALRQILETAHESIRTWLEALKIVYLIFSIPPWFSHLARSVVKEEKYYFWDWGMVSDHGARFENFIAVQLERAIASWNERGKGPFKLYYLRTKDGHETDFAIANSKKVFLLVEAKESEASLDKNLVDFQEKVQSPLAIQVVNKKGLCVQKGKGLYLLSPDRFLSLLP